jgi:NitT/TauT family transport system ATP-binding protein
LTSPFVDINGLNKSFPSSDRDGRLRVDVIKNLSLQCEHATFTTIFGPNGCGKSTLLNLLAGIIEPDSGIITIGGEQHKQQHVGYVFQDFRGTLFPWKRAIDNISYPLVLKGTPRSEGRNQAEKLLQRFEINIPIRNYPYQLSGGQQQLTSIARALIGDPVFLILDEPFSALDYETRFFMQQKVLEIWKESKTTVLFVSHDLDEAIYLADRVVFLTNRPASVTHVMDVDLPRPRKLEIMESNEFMKLKAEGLKIFREALNA